MNREMMRRRLDNPPWKDREILRWNRWAVAFETLTAFFGVMAGIHVANEQWWLVAAYGVAIVINLFSAWMRSSNQAVRGALAELKALNEDLAEAKKRMEARDLDRW